MICDRVTFRGQTLLTIYHQGIDNNALKRYVNRTQKIGRYNLIFIETYVEDKEIENIKDWIYKEEGLLEPGSSKNPYGNAVCAYMYHYGYANKPSCIYSFKNHKYSLKISADDFLCICEFIKKYTGIDIESNPMFCGDVFIFKCNEFNQKCKKNDGIVLENIPANSIVIVHFKNGDLIISSKIVKVEYETDNLEIISDKPWVSHDIEIFNGKELIYFRRDISYIRRISLRTTIKGINKIVKLNNIASEYTIEKDSESHTSHIGEPIDKFMETFQTSAFEIKKFIKSEKPDDQVFFIKPKEISMAMKLIVHALESAQDELWIFDSYFTDKNGIGQILDWLRIVVNCQARFKNIVFYCNDPNKTLNTDEIKSKMEKDEVLSETYRSINKFGIHFYQVKSPIHDRFVLINNNKKFFGLSIGTSFNSLDRNYYCISKLSHSASKIIYNELIQWMKNDNIVSDEEV